MAEAIKLKNIKKITTLTKNDIFLVETDSGTRVIALEDLEKIFGTVPDGAAAHNAAPPLNRNLLEIYTLDEIYARIADGSYNGLFLGDYFDITISTEYTTSEVVRCILAHFDYYWMTGDTAFTKHHAVIVPKNCFTATAKMNETNTTEGGYFNSNMCQTVMSKYNTALDNVLGEHLLNRKELLTNTVNATTPSMAGAGITGASTNWGWYNNSVCLMSEAQVYGTTVWSSSGYDAGVANRQLALFWHDPTAKVCKLGGTDDASASNRYWYWLRNVVSASNFAGVSHAGYSDCDGASSGVGVRPLFCIG